MRSFLSLMGADPSADDRFYFETSWLFPPLILSLIRGLFSLYAFTTIFVIFGWNGTHGESRSSARSFSYFTHLSYWGLAFYFLVVAIHTFLYSRTGRSVLFDKLPRSLRALHSLFYSTILVYPFIVLIVFWVALYDGEWYSAAFDSWTNISQHAIQPLFPLFEIIFSTTPPPPLLHLPFLILILALYLALAYITYASEGWYTYPFLDPGVDGENNEIVAGYSFAIAAGTMVIFGVVWGLIWVRRRVVGPDKRKLAEVRVEESSVEVTIEEGKET